MARIRTIKPEFFTSEDIVSLSPLARIFFVSLWCEADREGRFVWKSRTLKMRYLPADDCSADELSDELVNAGLIFFYEAEGRTIACIPGFKRHQIINNKEAESILPSPNECESSVEASRVKGALKSRKDASQGKERKEGKERIPTRAERTASFDVFWKAYPRKTNKGQAEKIFDRLSPDETLLTTIIEAIERAKSRDQWRRDGGKYIPYPSTWLNAKGWEDEDIQQPANEPSYSNPIFAGML